ncbi:DegV family EDD domain-containing protein [uncultured Ilyobacter sp.]|uniref:DegV family EDD domain-containing protein n=1 Tax=uncultured Ilyobacter sp. TaxID=544433 RepID=UPI0029C79F4A|nr:DegV family EDD domain-containing protein [uncultured Ilyobacter sp.]
MKIEVKVLNVQRLTKLFIASSRWLSKYADVLNDLNVYPVPDGDTGTNMSMTLQSVENELVKLNHEPDMEEFCEIVSEAILLGARGNSGTILSQIIQGFLSGISHTENVTVDDAVVAFKKAKEKAYQSVTEPVEGTILTVIRAVSEEAEKYKGPKDDFIFFLAHLKNVAAQAVDETPNLLPKLKEAGVVDAGGKGMFYILEGFEKSVTDPEMLKDLERIVQSQSNRRERLEHSVASHEEINFKYCTEFIIESGDFDLEKYKSEILTFGDSVICAQTSKKTKTHIHTNNPGKVIEIAGKLGDLYHIKIENMKIQHRTVLSNDTRYKSESSAKAKTILKNENSRPVAYFAIADNFQIGELFVNSGATAVLIGGQTQNPSVSDIEKALDQIKTDKIIMLPNNKNIISSAKIAAERSSKDITVIETKSMLEGHYILKNKAEKLNELVKGVKRNISVEITRAVRDTKSDDMVIKKGDHIALINGKISKKSDRVERLIEDVYSTYITEGTLSVFAIIGKDSTEDGNRVLKPVSDVRYSDYPGMQDNYSYYIYIENRDPELPEIAIVTDSTSDLNEEFIGDLNIDIIPLKLKFESDKYYKDGADISKGEFWKKVLRKDVIPKTSQPSPGEFKDLYERLFNKGYKKIISIHISSKLSGTQQAAKVARGMLGREKDVAILDSKSVTLGLGHLALESARLIKEGHSFDEVLEWIDEAQNKIKVYFVVRELSFLEKGGRIGKASSMIGDVFQIKPVLTIENGEVCTEKKPIGDIGAMRYMEKIIKNESKNGSIILYTGWGGTQYELDSADQLRSIGDKQKKSEYRGRFEIGAAIGSHSGPVYGMVIFPKIR